jgi:lysophospholipase L1-like esterase
MRRVLLMLFGMALTSAAGPASQPATVRMLALGDSYTIGESVDASKRWPVQLAAALRSGGADVAEPTIIARTGWTTANLSDAMDHADLRGPYDLVGLLIGVNNQFQGRSEDEYRRQFSNLLVWAIALAGGRAGRVMVLSIPDWGVTPFAKQMGADPAVVGAAIDRFDAINKELTAKARAIYVDITPLTRQRRDLVADDGLHPSGEMYAKWVEAALPAARTALAP